ncbi:MAG: hypothetical protein V4525_13900 [Pseudomonadota bacterium]
MWLLLFVTLAIALALLPLIPAILELVYPTDIKPLNIEYDYDRNIRRFAERFSHMLRKEISILYTQEESIELSAEKAVPPKLFALPNLPLALKEHEVQQQQLNRRLIGLGTLKLPANMKFNQEIYAENDLIGGEKNHIRAAVAENTIFLAPHTIVSRWIHAREIKISHNVKLYGRTSGKEKISFEGSAFFERLHAPIICFGNEIEKNLSTKNFQPTPFQPAVDIGNSFQHYSNDNRSIAIGDFKLPPNSVFEGNLIVKGNLNLSKGVIINGSVKVHGKTILESEVTIHGALIGIDTILCGKSCSIDGPIVSEKEIDIMSDCRLGHEDKPTSINSPIIKIDANNTVVYGTVWAAKQGIVYLLENDNNKNPFISNVC